MKKRHMKNNVLEIYDDDNNLVLSISEELSDDGTMVIKLAGEIKNTVAYEFEDEVMAALSVCKKIELNFEKVSYIASMALKSLLSIQQIIDETDDSDMILTDISPQVMDIFNESGFSEILEIKKE